MQLSQFELSARFQELKSARSGMMTSSGVFGWNDVAIQCMNAKVWEEERITVCLTV